MEKTRGTEILPNQDSNIETNNIVCPFEVGETVMGVKNTYNGGGHITGIVKDSSHQWIIVKISLTREAIRREIKSIEDKNVTERDIIITIHKKPKYETTRRNIIEEKTVPLKILKRINNKIL